MAKKAFVQVAVLAGIFFFTSVAVAQEEQWLQYHYDRMAREITGYSGGTGIKLQTEKPQDLILPEFSSDKPLFGKWSSPMAKNKFLWLALDRSKKNGPYDRLFIDAKDNGSLNDETPAKPYQADGRSAQFGPVQLVFDGQDGPITYHLNFTCYVSGDKNYLYSSLACWYEGDITVGNVKKHCILIDQTCNGTFNDKSGNFWKSDRIIIGQKENERNSRFVGKYIEVDDKLYQLDVAKDGAYVKLSPAENVVFGNIKVPETINTFAAGGNNGLFYVKLDKGLGKLPVGKYRIYLWELERKDDNSVSWKLKAQQLQSKKSLFDVNENTETALAVGEPVTCELKMQRESGIGPIVAIFPSYRFVQSLTGQLDEDLEILKNNNRPPAPKLSIKNGDGSYDKKLNFEYG